MKYGHIEKRRVDRVLTSVLEQKWDCISMGMAELHVLCDRPNELYRGVSEDRENARNALPRSGTATGL